MVAIYYCIIWHLFRAKKKTHSLSPDKPTVNKYDSRVFCLSNCRDDRILSVAFVFSEGSVARKSIKRWLCQAPRKRLLKNRNPPFLRDRRRQSRAQQITAAAQSDQRPISPNVFSFSACLFVLCRHLNRPFILPNGITINRTISVRPHFSS